MSLNAAQRHLLRLTQKEAAETEDGWAKVSELVWPVVSNLPAELIELCPADDGGFVRLTAAGKAVLLYS